ncbi:DUF1656 domain-containing protein [Starkeya sp. ORNL1]|nr:DUF1656 domain-containing protein [Starkeya sp. ORNL1]QJP13820.1 DUF1656 domain-containing protein [Starkeya sp. ORNL1]
MMPMFHELVIGGVLVAPIVSYAVAALLIIFLLRPLLHAAGISRMFSHPTVAELGLYVTIFGLITLYS